MTDSGEEVLKSDEKISKKKCEDSEPKSGTREVTYGSMIGRQIGVNTPENKTYSLENDFGVKKNGMLVEIRRMIRECVEIGKELITLKSYVQHENYRGKEGGICESNTIKSINYSTLIGICQKIIFDCCSLDALPMAELQFLQETAYAAALRKETKAMISKQSSPNLDTCLARIEHLRIVLSEARENTRQIKTKMSE